MPIEQLLILALLQGLTEFLPISSSAHLILVPALTDWEDQGALIDVAVHVGSLFAVLIYFRRDVAGLFAGAGSIVRGRIDWNSRLLLYIALATVPTVLAGGVLKMTGAVEHLRSAEVIAWATIGFGLLLYVADRYGASNLRVEDVTARGAMFVGLAQAIALIPGTSRSGITMTASRYLGYRPSEAARFSMLLSIPTILALGLLAGLELAEQSGENLLWVDAIWAAVLSFISAFIAIWFFMRLVDKIGMLPFVLYRLVLGFGLLAYLYI